MYFGVSHSRSWRVCAARGECLDVDEKRFGRDVDLLRRCRAGPQYKDTLKKHTFHCTDPEINPVMTPVVFVKHVAADVMIAVMPVL